MLYHVLSSKVLLSQAFGHILGKLRTPFWICLAMVRKSNQQQREVVNKVKKFNEVLLLCPTAIKKGMSQKKDENTNLAQKTRCWEIGVVKKVRTMVVPRDKKYLCIRCEIA